MSANTDRFRTRPKRRSERSAGDRFRMGGARRHNSRQNVGVTITPRGCGNVIGCFRVSQGLVYGFSRAVPKIWRWKNDRKFHPTTVSPNGLRNKPRGFIIFFWKLNDDPSPQLLPNSGGTVRTGARRTSQIRRVLRRVCFRPANSNVFITVAVL